MCYKQLFYPKFIHSRGKSKQKGKIQQTQYPQNRMGSLIFNPILYVDDFL